MNDQVFWPWAFDWFWDWYNNLSPTAAYYQVPSDDSTLTNGLDKCYQLSAEYQDSFAVYAYGAGKNRNDLDQHVIYCSMVTRVAVGTGPVDEPMWCFIWYDTVNDIWRVAVGITGEHPDSGDNVITGVQAYRYWYYRGGDTWWNTLDQYFDITLALKNADKIKVFWCPGDPWHGNPHGGLVTEPYYYSTQLDTTHLGGLAIEAANPLSGVHNIVYDAIKKLLDAIYWGLNAANEIQEMLGWGTTPVYLQIGKVRIQVYSPDQGLYDFRLPARTWAWIAIELRGIPTIYFRLLDMFFADNYLMSKWTWSSIKGSEAWQYEDPSDPGVFKVGSECNPPQHYDWVLFGQDMLPWLGLLAVIIILNHIGLFSVVKKVIAWFWNWRNFHIIRQEKKEIDTILKDAKTLDKSIRKTQSLLSSNQSVDIIDLDEVMGELKKIERHRRIHF